MNLLCHVLNWEELSGRVLESELHHGDVSAFSSTQVAEYSWSFDLRTC